jgi:hypothetical protein
MAKTGLLATLAGISGLLTSTQIAAAESLQDSVGLTAASVIGFGWLVLLAVLGLAIILPMIRR